MTYYDPKRSFEVFCHMMQNNKRLKNAKHRQTFTITAEQNIAYRLPDSTTGDDLC